LVSENYDIKQAISVDGKIFVYPISYLDNLQCSGTL